MERILLATIVVVLLMPTGDARADGVTLRANTLSVPAAASMHYLATGKNLSPQKALSMLTGGKGTPVDSDYPGYGFSSLTYWFLLNVTNDSPGHHWYVEASLPFTDLVDFYRFNGDKLVSHMIGGDHVAPVDRTLRHPHIVFPVTLASGTQTRFLFRVKSENVIEMPVTLYSPEGFRLHDVRRTLATGFYYGIVAIMCLYNLMIFFSIRDSSYLFYVLYLGFFGLTLLARDGLALQWIWPDYPGWNHVSQPLLVLLTLSFSMFFADRFLDLERINPRLSRLINGLAWIVMIASPLSLMDLHAGIWISTILLIPWSIGVVVLSAVRSTQGYSAARYFLLAFAAVGISVTLLSLRAFTLVPGSWWLEHSLQISTALEALLLSFALANRLTILKQQNERIQQKANEELEQRVQERTRELNEALNARSEFLAVMSHEVRTPLNGILGSVDLMREEAEAPKLQRHLRVIEQSGRTLLQLLNDILDYSRIEAGKMPIEMHDFDLASMVDECLAMFERKALDNGVALSSELLPGSHQLVRGDELRVRQVLANLVGNAVKFTSNGIVVVRMKREEDNANYVVFEIQDSGIGISPEKLSALFDHFYQLDSSTRRRYGGTGLGLAISRQLVEIMGGEIGAESKPGSGSLFWFRLPLPPADGKREPDPMPGTGTRATHRARLLIVDDNHINLMVAEGLCRKLGHEVVTAESGMEAVAVLLSDSRGFDLVLMDCEMPEMDGFQTTAQIRQLQNEGRVPPVPIIALTAHAIPEKVRACHDAGMVSHIAKPINSEKLGREIESVLSSSGHGANDRRSAPAD